MEELYNKESEEYIVGCMLVDSDTIPDCIDKIVVQDFYAKNLGYIFETIKEMFKLGKQVDIVTVSEELKFRGLLKTITRSYINELASNITTTKLLKQNIKILLKYSKKRFLLVLSDSIAQQVDNNVDVDNILKSSFISINDQMLRQTKQETVTLLSGVDSVMEEVARTLESEDGISGLSTGFNSLNKRINGLQKSKLYILGARPRVGKSALAQQIAEYVAINHNVLFYSLEMRSEQYTKRSLFRRTGINQDILSTHRIQVNEAMDKLATASAELANLKLYINDKAECTLTSIELGILKMIKDKGSCDLLVIDYAQLMQSDERSIKDPFQVASRNCTGLKRLANKYNIPILLLAQLNRQVDNRADNRPLLSDLKDSGSYEQDADVIMFLYREELYKPTPMNRYQAELIIAKNREGMCSTIQMAFNGSKTEFKEM